MRLNSLTILPDVNEPNILDTYLPFIETPNLAPKRETDREVQAWRGGGKL